MSANLGSQLAAHLYDRLLTTSVEPGGIEHLERPELTTDVAMARDFDLGACTAIGRQKAQAHAAAPLR